MVKPNCSRCLNDEGYGWICDQNPKVFEPEHKLIRTEGEKNTWHSDFSGIPRNRRIYCRNFIPEDWRSCIYQNGRWYLTGEKSAKQ